MSPFTDTHFLVVHGMSTVAAMFINAQILQINCHNVGPPRIYLFASNIAPRALVPTALQTSIPHQPFVDLLPFPSIRTKILQAGSLISPKEMWNDLSDGGVKVWGRTPWEEKGWEFGESFIVKWWFLLDDEILSTANFWRGTRDEPMLSMGAIKSKLGSGLLNI